MVNREYGIDWSKFQGTNRELMVLLVIQKINLF